MLQVGSYLKEQLDPTLKVMIDPNQASLALTSLLAAEVSFSWNGEIVVCNTFK